VLFLLKIDDILERKIQSKNAERDSFLYTTNSVIRIPYFLCHSKR